MIDEVDKKILNMLQSNARVSNAQIAREVHMAPSAILERIRKLERKQIITEYTARINPKEVGRSLTAFTFVKVEEEVGKTTVGQRLAAIPGVLETHYCAGQASYLVKVRVRDTEGLANMLTMIGEVPNVKDTNTTIVLRTVKESMMLPLDDDVNAKEDE